MGSERRIEVTITMTLPDAFRANLAVTGARTLRIFAILWIFAALFIVGNHQQSGSWFTLDSATLIITTIAILIGPYFLWTLYTRSKRNFRATRVYQSPLNYVFTDKGMEASGPTFKAESQWSNLSWVKETRSLFILGPSSAAMTILPKRCFPDSHAVEMFRQIIREHVSGKVKLLAS